MRNISNKVELVSREDNFSMVSPAVLYRVHENTGSDIVDALGNGPNFTLAGSGTGTPWANVGWLTPDGTNHYAQTAQNDHMHSLCRMDTDWAQILLGVDYYFDGGITPNPENIFFAGKSDNIVGGWGVAVNTSNAVVVTTRGIGASNHVDSAFAGAALTSLASSRISLVVELVRTAVNTVEAYLYINGASASSLTGGSAINLLANSATSLYGSIQQNLDSQAYTIGAQPNGTNARVRLMNSSASNGRVARLWVSRHDTYDSTLGLKLAKDLYKLRGEKPRCMNGL